MRQEFDDPNLDVNKEKLRSTNLPIWINPKEPFLWIGLLFLGIVIGVLAYYIWLFWLSENTSDQSNYKPVKTITTTINEIAAPEEDVELSSLSIDSKEYSLGELIELANAETNFDWVRLFQENSDSIEYFYYSSAGYWKLAISEDNLQKIVNAIKKAAATRYALVVSDYPIDAKFSVTQIVAQLKRNGYNAVSERIDNKLKIKVLDFASPKIAMETGEDIYEFFRKSGILLANFSVQKLPRIKTNYSNLFLITTNNLDSVQDTYKAYKQLKDIVNKSWLVFLIENYGDYNINIGFFSSPDKADLAAQNIDIDYSNLEIKEIKMVEQINFN